METKKAEKVKKIKKVKETKKVFSKLEKVIYEMMTDSDFPKSYLDSSQGVNYTAYRNAIHPIDTFFNQNRYGVRIAKWGVEYSINSRVLFLNHLKTDALCTKFNKLNLHIGCTEKEEYSAMWNTSNPNKEYDKLHRFLNKHFEEEGVSTEYNTYNSDTYIDCTFQYFNIGNDYIAIAFHSGCDVRGGYQKYRLFEVQEYDSFMCNIFEESTYIDEFMEKQEVKYIDDYENEIELSDEQFCYVKEFLDSIRHLYYTKIEVRDRRYLEMREVINNWEERESMPEYLTPEVYNPNQLKLVFNK